MPDTVDLSATEDQVSLPQPSAKCPCCGSEAKREVIYRVNSIPIQSCVLLDRYEDAISYEKRDLELAYCTACGFIHNQIFDATIVEYAAVTEESQHYSGTFSGFAKRLAKEIAETYPLDGKHVLEIGCGKGDFLIELCALADCTGLGIDPGFSHTRLNATEFAQGYDTDRIKFISDYFDTSYLHLKADLIMCRHTLEHIPDVATFVGNIRESIGNCQGTGVFFETPDAERVLAEGAFWDIYYEHCSYFTSASHAGVFKHNGFNVDAIRLDYDAQYIIHYSSPAAQNSGSLNSAFGNLDSIQQLVDAFPAKVAKVQRHWRDFIERKRKVGKKIVLWGGGSKAVAFVTTLGLNDELASIVDINPFKQGKFLPGSGHQVTAPKDLKKIMPDVVIVMNPIYVPEIRKSLNELGLAPEVVAV